MKPLLEVPVAELLVDYQTPGTGLRPFSPEFLGRFSDIVIFNPDHHPGHAAFHIHLTKRTNQLSLPLVKVGARFKADSCITSRRKMR